jgi:hypothetical protein
VAAQEFLAGELGVTDALLIDNVRSSEPKRGLGEISWICKSRNENRKTVIEYRISRIPMESGIHILHRTASGGSALLDNPLHHACQGAY